MIPRPAIRKSFHSLATAESKTKASPSAGPTISRRYLRLLSSCKSLRSLLQIHGSLIVSGIRKDNFALTHLINSYSLFKKCDLARCVFDSASNPGLILWNSMIRGYIGANHFGEALEMYHHMLEKGLEPDKYTYNFVLKACTASLDFQEGANVHRQLAQKGLECDVFIGTSLVDMYCKMGNLKCAGQVFEKMPQRDVVAWNAMIAGFSQSMDPCRALEIFRSMQLGGVQPSSVSLLNLFPAVGKLRDIQSCGAIHGYALRREFSNSVVNGLIDMYCKCGRADVARRVFDGMQNRDGISWGTMTAGYVHNGHFHEVLELFDRIKDKHLKMNNVCAVSALLAAAEMRDIRRGKEVHDYAIQQGIDSDVLVATPIMTMYAKCGEVRKAKQLFDVLQGRDLVAWSALIAALAQCGSPQEALSLFRDMQNEKLKPNRVTLMSVLPACAELSNLKLGKSLHCYAVKENVDLDLSVGTSLVSMYSRFGMFTAALVIFNRMPCTEVMTWNALITGYAQIGDASNAMDMFRRLRQSHVHPDPGTMMGVLPACALLCDLKQGTCIHGQIIKSGFDFDLHVKNALLDMYAKCSSLASAEFLFNRAEFTKNEGSWNVMIVGYIHNGRTEKAISTFHQMKLENFLPNLVTLVSILPAAAYLATVREGMFIHACIIRMGFQSNTLIGNSLIDMYAKCGHLNYSEKMFDEMNDKNAVSWNALLAGYAAHGHAGLVEEGKENFHLMTEMHHLEPGLEHYACMVDLLGRAALFDDALELIEKMPVEPDAGVWGALLGASRMHSNVKVGKIALDHLVKLEPGNPAHYVVLSNIYAQNRRWADAGSTRLMISETGLKKTRGSSWFEVKKSSGDQSHPQLGWHGMKYCCETAW